MNCLSNPASIFAVRIWYEVSVSNVEFKTVKPIGWDPDDSLSASQMRCPI
jgi:hypothetical protein